MVSTRQMSITTAGPEAAGTSNVSVATTSTSSRTASNSLAPQNGSTTRQQSNSGNSNSSYDYVTAAAKYVVARAGNGDDGSGDGDNNAVATVINDHKQLSLSDMPFEILDKIFSYVGYREVSNIRLVSTQMNQVGVTILNSTFSKLQTQLLKRFQNIKAVMPRRESARRSHPLFYECDIMETCCMRLTLLQMTFGRYIEHKHCCFFPGAILDEVYNIINYVRMKPNLGRPYKITEELIDLSTMAMEYFKDHLEPSMPQIGSFNNGFFKNSNSSGSSSTTRTSTRNCYLFESSSTSTSTSAATLSTSNKSAQSSSMPSPPQSNMVLRKGIRKIKQGMKKYNNQLTVLRTDLRFCKRKSTDQTKQISELQNMLADQQKQTLEYENRLDDNEKKSEEMSRKISTLLQELNKCKIELHYWRSKSPATPICNSCGQTTLSVPPANGDLLALMNQSGSHDEIINVTGISDLELETEVQSHESSLVDLTQLINKQQSPVSNSLLAAVAAATTETTEITSTMTTSTTTTMASTMPIQLSAQLSQSASVPLVLDATKIASNCNGKNIVDASVDKTHDGPVTLTAMMATETVVNSATIFAAAAAAATSAAMSITTNSAAQNEHQQQKASNNSVILTVGTPRFYGKRKADDCSLLFGSGNTSGGGSRGGCNAINGNGNERNSSGVAVNGNLSTASASAATATTTTVNKTATHLANSANNSNISDNCNKKARRVQSKIKIQNSNMNIKTRNK